MRFAALLLLLMMGFATSAEAAELKRTHTLGKANADRMEGWSGHIKQVSWLDEQAIVYGTESGAVVCHDLKTNADLWSVKDVFDVRDWTVSRKHRRLAVLAQKENKQFGDQIVRVFDCATGKVIYSADRDQLATLLKRSYVFPSQIALTGEDAKLVVCLSANKFEPSGFVLDPTYSKVETTFDIDAWPRELTLSPDGARATLVCKDDVLCTREMRTNKELYFAGKRVLVAPEGFSGAIDVPFTSHARHDGMKTLIYTIDNSWGTGTVHVRDLETKAEKSFNARNGHIEIDVDFARKRIALTGTETGLTVTDFDGKVIADLPKATLQRNTSVEFSPSGKQLAVASWDNTVMIYALAE